MASVNSQARNNATNGGNRCGFFRFSFFSFSAAATAEGIGV